jgi:hypothetical protein
MRRVNDNGVMDANVTRRSLARMLAVAAAVPQAAVPQTSDNADLESARELMRANLQLIAKVKLTMATEPAVHFKA